MITLDSGVHDAIKNRGLNVSAICEDTLREIAGSFDKTTDPKTCEHKWSWAFTVPSGLAKECLKCGTIKSIEIEKC